jgi:hypothetical protein
MTFEYNFKRHRSTTRPLFHAFHRKRNLMSDSSGTQSNGLVRAIDTSSRQLTLEEAELPGVLVGRSVLTRRAPEIVSRRWRS